MHYKFVTPLHFCPVAKSTVTLMQVIKVFRSLIMSSGGWYKSFFKKKYLQLIVLLIAIILYNEHERL